MRIFLQPEVRSGLGERTFWDFAADEFAKFPGVEAVNFSLPPTCDNGGRLYDDDVVLQYSTLGPCLMRGGIKVALCWELHPEMIARGIPGDWASAMSKIEACARGSDYRVIASEIMRPFYEPFGAVDYLPIGVDAELFSPSICSAGARWESVREAYGLPFDSRVGFWCGTNHCMKGYERLLKYASDHPEVRWIIVWKSKRERATEFPADGVSLVHCNQDQLATIMGIANFWLCTSRLRPFYLVEWEAMAANLPMIDASGMAAEKDFVPSANPREDVLSRKWDRASAAGVWRGFLEGLVK